MTDVHNSTPILSYNEDSGAEPSGFTHQVYPIRWAIVIVLAFLSGTNGFLWISYAPAANHFSEYYSTTEYVLNWMQMIFPITTLILGLPSSLLVDWLGIKFVVTFSATCNLICGLARLLSSCSAFWPSSGGRLGLVMFGHVIASLAQPFCLFAPTTLALEWFPDHQRTTANTIGSLGNALGVLLGSALVPLLVPRPSAIPRFNYATMGLTCLGMVLSIVFVRRGKPKTPPSVAAHVFEQTRRTHSTSVTVRLRTFVMHTFQALKCIPFLLLTVTFSCGLAYFSALSTLFQQILCTKGYSNEYAGLCGSLMLAAGLVLSAPIAIYVDRTGNLAESVKVCFVLATLGSVGLSVLLWFPNQHGLTIFFTMWLGGFGFAQYSLSLELAADITFPVPEAITTGLMLIVSQILAIIFVVGMQASAPAVYFNQDVEPTCGPAVTPQDYSIPNMAVTAILVIIGIIQLLALRVTYKRREATAGLSFQVDPPSDRTVLVPAN